MVGLICIIVAYIAGVLVARGASGLEYIGCCVLMFAAGWFVPKNRK